MKRTTAFAFHKSTQNYHVYWELNEQGNKVLPGLPKEGYALNCRPDQYLPHAVYPDRHELIIITVESVGAATTKS